MFDYDVMSESDALKERFSLLEDGIYDATIIDCIDKISQSSGNPMFEVHLRVYDAKGKQNEVKDFLTFTPKTMWKVIHCCKSSGLHDEYESKKLHPGLMKNKNVRVKIRTQKGSVIPIEKLQGKPEGSCYPDKNVVDDYIAPLQQKSSILNPLGIHTLPSNDFINDEIPF